MKKKNILKSLALVLSISVITTSVPVNAETVSENTLEIVTVNEDAANENEQEISAEGIFEEISGDIVEVENESGKETKTDANGNIVSPSLVTDADIMQDGPLSYKFIEVEPQYSVEEISELTPEQTSETGVYDASYDPRSLGLMTSVKDQGKEGLCWVYSSIGAMESSIMKNEGQTEEVDLSERYMTNLVHKDEFPSMAMTDFVNKGLYGYYCFNKIKTYPVMEESAVSQIESGSTLTDDYSCPRYTEDEKKHHYRTDDNIAFRHLTSDNDTMKKAIMMYGGVEASYASNLQVDEEGTAYNWYTDLSGGYFDGSKIKYKNDYCYYDPNVSTRTNHEVVIVGWDDDFPATLFKAYNPSRNGAWLCKNSWGEKRYTGAKGTGYFWISYDETSLTLLDCHAASFTYVDYDGEDSDLLKYGIKGVYQNDSDWTTDSLGREVKKAVRIESVKRQMNAGDSYTYTVVTNPVVNDGIITSYDRRSEDVSLNVAFTGTHVVKMPETFAVASGDTYCVARVVGEELKIDSYYPYIETTENFNRQVGTFKETEYNIPIGEAVRTEVVFDRSETDYEGGQYSIADTSIATVTSDGEVKAKSLGTTTLTFISADKQTKTSCDIVVTQNGDYFTQDSYSILKGESQYNTVKEAYEGLADVDIAIGDKSIISYNGGTMTGLKVGKTQVTAKKDGKLIGSCMVTVYVDVTGITLDKNTLTLNYGETAQVGYTITPEEAQPEVIIESQNKNIVDVDEDGNLITKSFGLARVKYSAQNEFETLMVTVPIPEDYLKSETDEAKAGVATSINCKDIYKDAVVNVNSSNTKVAKYGDGKIIPVSVGTCTITVYTPKDSEIASYELTVKPFISEVTTVSKSSLTLNYGETKTLSATVDTRATDRTYAWSSSNENVVTIDDGGSIKAVGFGKATIKAQANDGGSYGTCIVTVPVPEEYFVTRSVDIVDSGTRTLEKVTTYDDARTPISVAVEDEKIAVLEDGKVSSKDYGETKIVATLEDGIVVDEIPVSVSVGTVKITGFVDKEYKDGDEFTIGVTNCPGFTSLSIDEYEITNGTDKVVAIEKNNSSVNVSVVGPGEEVITVKYGDLSDSITVRAYKLVEEITSAKNEYTLDVGTNFTLNPVVLPSNATYQTLKFESDDKDIEVTQDGVVKIPFLEHSGVVHITVKATDESGIFYVYTINYVYTPPKKEDKPTDNPGGNTTGGNDDQNGTLTDDDADNGTDADGPEEREEKPFKLSKGDTKEISGVEYRCIGDTEVSVKKVKAEKSVKIGGTIRIGEKTYKVTEIEDKAFAGNKKITSVVIGANVRVVGKNAFKGCISLKKVSMPNTVTTIKDGAFYGCKALTGVSIPKNVTQIGAKAFYGCSKLKTVTIKSYKIKKIGSKAFCKIKKGATIRLQKKNKGSVKKLLKKKYDKTTKIK